MAHTLPELGYDYDKLEPLIDARTMEIHHSKHHNAYVTNLNTALAGKPDLEAKSAGELIADLGAVPEDIRTAVRNNGGGFLNHGIFWTTLKPGGGGEPTGALGDAITAQFGSFEALKKEFADKAVGQFGSGWAWLELRADGGLQVHGHANQDNPVMHGASPILGVDVWEHAYYLSYQNRRPDYVQAWFEVVNWDEADRRYRSYAAQQ